MKANSRTVVFTLCRTSIIVALAGGLSGLLSAQTTAPTDASEPEATAHDRQEATGPQSAVANPEQSTGAGTPSPDKILQWLTQLDDDRYAAREAAQQSLAHAEAAALAGVGDVARSQVSLESSTRALNILLEWSEADDPELSMQALEQVAQLGNRPLEASLAAERLAAIRERAAIAAVEKMGGRVVVETQRPMLFGNEPSLQVILGPEWQGGIQGIRRVAEIRRISTLSLWSVALDDEAVSEVAKLTELPRLEIYGADLSDHAVDQLKKSLGKERIDFRPGGARLGIRGNPIQDVIAESAAAKAGLQPNDEITQIGDKKVEDFIHLTQLIAEYKAGDKVELTVQRGTTEKRTFKTTVRFDRWGEGDPVPMPNIRRIGNGQIQIIGPGRMAPGIPLQPFPQPQIQPIIPQAKEPGR